MSLPFMGREAELIWLGVKGGECHGYAVFSPDSADLAEKSVCGKADRLSFTQTFGVGYGVTRCPECAELVKVRGYRERA